MSLVASLGISTPDVKYAAFFSNRNLGRANCPTKAQFEFESTALRLGVSQTRILLLQLHRLDVGAAHCQGRRYVATTAK